MVKNTTTHSQSWLNGLKTYFILRLFSKDLAKTLEMSDLHVILGTPGIMWLNFERLNIDLFRFAGIAGVYRNVSHSSLFFPPL